MLKHHEATQEQAKIKISQLSSRLRFLSAIDTIQDVLTELDKLVKKLDEEGKDLMSKVNLIFHLLSLTYIIRHLLPFPYYF